VCVGIFVSSEVVVLFGVWVVWCFGACV